MSANGDIGVEKGGRGVMSKLASAVIVASQHGDGSQPLFRLVGRRSVSVPRYVRTLYLCGVSSYNASNSTLITSDIVFAVSVISQASSD
jgi:hypothetical protein